MARDRGDRITADLLSWLPPSPVEAFDDKVVHAATLAGQLSRALKETLSDTGRTRGEVADAMSAFLDEAVSENMLNAYVSEARSDHVINVIRLIALIVVTRDGRMLNWIADMIGLAVIDRKYLQHIEAVMLADKQEEIARRLETLRKNIKAGSVA